MERGQATPAQRFVNDLNQLRLRAGRPSYSTLERLSGHELRRTTMSDILNGHRIHLPDWRFVHEFVTACRAAAAENRLAVNELGTVADWKQHWDSADSGVIDASFPGRGGPQPARADPAAAPPADARSRALTAESPESRHDDAAARSPAWGPLPPRLPDFTGREEWLRKLRQFLARADRVGVVAIQGLPGVGKTQLAIEYASRYAREYDLVWWVPCDNAEAAHDAVSRLAAHAGASHQDRDYTELFDLLRRRQRFERWLLVFDNADDPEDIRDLVPPLPGDVLVTTRSSRWEASGELLELEVFERTESIEFLRRRMRGFTETSAHRLAEGVGDLPLLLEHAVESHIAVGPYLARLRSDPVRLLSEQPSDYHAPVISVWKTAIDRLRTDGSGPFDLLCCLVHFGTGPIPRESLERGSFLPDISVHRLLRDPIRLGGAIVTLRRAGLLRMNPATRSLAVHPVTRYIVRDLAARAHEEERFRHDVHLLLAAADPLTPDDPTTWQGYEELRGHAIASDTLSCRQEPVRKFVVNLVRYLTATGEPRTGAALADRALTRWETGLSNNGSASADCHLAMRAAKADALFACGAWEAASRIRRETRVEMCSDPDRWTAEIIELDVTSGARSRIEGDFTAALSQDRESVRVHLAEFGHDDPRTFRAVNSLIADLALCGSSAEAVSEASRVHRGCLAFYGDSGHPAVLAAGNVLGRCRWLAGEYGEAVSIMTEVHRGYDALADSGMVDENHPQRLVHEIDYAIARRDHDPSPSGLQALAGDLWQVRRRYWRTLGADHPQTIAATVILASVLRRIDGQADETVRLLEDAERRYRSTLPGHPYGDACAAFLAAVRSFPDGPADIDFTPLPL